MTMDPIPTNSRQSSQNLGSLPQNSRQNQPNRQQRDYRPPPPINSRRNFSWVWIIIFVVGLGIFVASQGGNTNSPTTFISSNNNTTNSRNQSTNANRTTSLLSGGTGLTNGASMYNGEFQVEYFCVRRGQGIDHNNTNWYCTNGNTRVYTLTQSDFDRICRDTYNRSDAFALQLSTNDIPAYSWRCFAYTNSSNSSRTSSSNSSSNQSGNTCGGMITLFREGSNAVVDFNGGGALRILRNYSGGANQTIAQLYDNATVELLEGPICYGGVWYWQIYYSPMNAYGWIAEGRNGDRFLCPISNRECS